MNINNFLFYTHLSCNVLQYVSKICGLNFEIVAITRPYIRFISFRWRFKISQGVELDFLGFVIRICFNVQSQRTKKIEVFSQGTHDSKNLRCGTLYIGDYENVNISSFPVLGIKLWLEEDHDFISQNLKVTGPLGGTFDFSVPRYLKFKTILITEPQKSSSTLWELWNAIWMRLIW